MFISSSPDIRAVVAHALKQYPWLRVEPGSRHGRVVNPRTRDFIPIPLTPSDVRAVKGLRGQLRRLAELGTGLIARKMALSY